MVHDLNNAVSKIQDFKMFSDWMAPVSIYVSQEVICATFSGKIELSLNLHLNAGTV